jgi:hypothetical protein
LDCLQTHYIEKKKKSAQAFKAASSNTYTLHH